MWLVVLMNAVCGSTFTLGKIILQYIQPMPLIALRMVISGICMVGYYYLRRSKKLLQPFGAHNLFLLLQFAFFGIFLSFSLEFWSLQYISSSKAALLYNISPFITAIYAYIFFSEKMTLKKLLGLIIGFMGFLPTLMAQTPGQEGGASFGFISWAELALFGSVCAYSYGWVVMKRLMNNYNNATMLNGMGMLLGGIMAVVTIMLTHNTLTVPSLWPFSGLFVALMLLGNIIFYNLYSILLKRYTVTFLAFTGFMAPFFTAIYSYFLLHEPIGWDFYVSSAIVFVGLYIFYQEELRQGYIVK